MGRDVFYITTPIYYANDVPHIGHGYNAVATDFIARYHRLRGEAVFHLTGTDEHGLKVARAAEANGVTPKEWVDQLEPRWREVWAGADIAYDDYIRTTEPRHHAAVAKILQAVYDNGHEDIYLGHYEGLYCVPCEAYYVEADLLPGGLCPVHERPVETLREDNYFFRLSSYADRLLAHYEAHPEAVLPQTRRNEVLSLIRGGLQDFSISRTTFDWGVPLPWDETHVTYVWFDALTNYITAAGYADDPDRFARLWPANIHSIGKDILRFHAVYWPAMLMAAEVELPDQVWAHGYLTVGGKKMSKTNLTGIHPFDLIDHFGVDSCARSPGVPTATSPGKRWSIVTTPTSPTASATSPPACSRCSAPTSTASFPPPNGKVMTQTSLPSPRTPLPATTPTWTPSNSSRPWRPSGPSSTEPTAISSRRNPGNSPRTQRAAPNSQASSTPAPSSCESSPC